MYYNENIEDIEKKFNTSKKGLTQKEAIKRQNQNGKNEIPKPKQKTIIDIFLEQFKSPIVFILIIAAVFSIIIKSYSDSIFIFLVIFINAIMGTYQEWGSEKNAEKLQELIKIKAKTIRDGIQKEINSEDIVVGDLIILESGDKVPADIVLIDTNNLGIDESILTGESIAKDKNVKINNIEAEIEGKTNIAYAGTIVTKGRGAGYVIAIGENTEFGKIADKVLIAEETKTPLVIRMDKFIKQISIGFLILASILSIMLYFKGYPIYEIFQNVVALTVSAIPEGLSVAMTIVLSIASSKMAKKNVIVKKLSAVESLGSCTVIATDKTGTLTANKQTAKQICLPSKNIAYIKGIGYNDIGEVDFDDNIDLIDKNIFKEIVKLGMLNNEATLKSSNGKWQYSGDAIDIAFLALGYKMNITLDENIISIIPYESKQKYSAVFYKNAKNNDEILYTAKGATEKILEFCRYMQIKNKEEKIDKNLILEQVQDLSKKGFRIIAIAKGKIENDVIEDDLNKMNNMMTYLGLVAFVDPIREDVKEAINECNLAGIKVVMVTGDHPLTANAIGERLGIKDIYARVSPIEKLEIVEDLKRKGEFVAVTGDGVNDSPALKAANIGVAMGSGTDIAKETGNMIITNDNFTSIVKGVEEGRKAYNNIRKVIYLLLSTGFSEVILYTLSIIFGLEVPLTAIQLLWLNLISNGIQGDALAFEKDIEKVMQKKAKSTHESIVNKLLISEILVSASIMAIIEFVFYLYLVKVQNTEIEIARTYMLTLMVFMENIHIFNCRGETISCFKIPLTNNRFLIFTIVMTSIIQIMIVQYMSIAKFFGLNYIPLINAISLFILTIPLVVVMEVFKKLLNIKNNPL